MDLAHTLTSTGTSGFHALVAALPEMGTYIDVSKVGIFMLAILGWAFVCQWVDRDTDAVKTNREQWNMIVVGGGITATFVWLVVPLTMGSSWGPFLLGTGFYLILAGGSIMAYVFHRNGRVIAAAKVMTLGHFKRLVSGDGKKKKQRVDKGQRVRIADSDGKTVEPPDDPEEYEQYSATQEFLFDALWRRSSDADMIAGKEKARLVFKVDGVTLEQKDRVTPEEAERVLLYLKARAGLNPEERRRPQLGTIQAGLLAHPKLYPIEVQTSGSTSGERLRLRIQSEESLKRIGQIGLREADLQTLKDVIKEQTGLVIVAGPKQSGVTTTQYALIREHDAFMQNLHSMERAPLLELDNITQNTFDPSKTDAGYARQLQSCLRREPDVVLVGECAERETAQIAARAATADRKIYMAMEGVDSFEVMQQLREMVEDPAVVGKSLAAVTNQRLVRKLCESCREAFKPEERLLKKLNLPVGKIEHFHRPPTEPIIDKKGNVVVCPICQGTGYLGRTAIYEILVVDDHVKALLAKGADLQRIKEYYRKRRTHDLWRAGLQKVFDGDTSLDEVLRVLRGNSK